MKPKEKICPICGNEFTPKGREKVCSDNCREEGKRISNERHKEKVMAMKNAQKPTDWKAITKKCKEAGLTYGQAVAKGVI